MGRRRGGPRGQLILWYLDVPHCRLREKTFLRNVSNYFQTLPTLHIFTGCANLLP